MTGQMHQQSSLFSDELFPRIANMPPGFQYWPDVLSPAEEDELVRWIPRLALKPFEFRGFEGKRRVISFGYRYDYSKNAVEAAGDIPDPLLRLREKIAPLAARPAADFQQALVTEYKPGTPIGWHRDRPQFGVIFGVSLLSPANFRLRRREADRWIRRSKRLEPRSGYVLTGEVRSDWEHSIPEVEALRYSITFRTLADGFRPSRSQ
jgi:alkylated DNA repair dioxygenase AlkB